MNTDNWSQPYGDFDCEVNAISFWLNSKRISLSPLIHYNWDFYFDQEEKLLRGCIAIEQLAQFLETSYNISSTVLPYDDIPLNELIIIPGNAYWLPYAKDYYLKQRLVHYYPAIQISEGNFVVWDSIFGNMGGSVQGNIIRKAYETIDRDILYLQERTSLFPSSKPMPYMLKTNFQRSYQVGVHIFSNEILSLLSKKGNLMVSMDFKRYFGNLQSLLMARECYFNIWNEFNEKIDQILNNWRMVIKLLMRMSYVGAAAIDQFLQALTRAVAYESDFLVNMDKKIGIKEHL